MSSIVSWVFAGILIEFFVHVTKIPISLPPCDTEFHVDIIFIYLWQ